MFPYFQVPRVEKKVFGKDNKDNNHNSLHLTFKNALIFVLGHYLFLGAHRIPRTLLSGNCSRVRGKNCDYFSHQMEATELCIQKTRTYAQQQAKNFYPGHLGESLCRVTFFLFSGCGLNLWIGFDFYCDLF